ncbi:hypothetical protein AAFC00_000186 [Neodothiora populina]|uniref:Anaphase-promoting complex subunit 4 n=1 Tax=Neodothiora populina TaxID=2781224 RepID=A0ABR3P1N8_9PEZI
MDISTRSAEPRLSIHAEKTLSQPIRPHLLSYCPRIDLFAVVNSEESVDVYRLGGQRAFNVKRRSPSSKVVGLEWIRDGKCLAIALSTGNVDIVSGETGKLVRQGGNDPFASDASGSTTRPGQITCLGWGTTLTDNVRSGQNVTMQSKSQGSTQKVEPSTEEWFDKLQGDPTSSLLKDDGADSDAQSRASMLHDLPRQLALINVESVLPRLSPILARANAGGKYDMFASQSALDDYFDSLQHKDGLAADVMLIGYEGGQVRLVVDDILEVGLPHKEPLPASETLKTYLQYASHPRSPYHILLHAASHGVEPEEGNRPYMNLSLSLFDIPLLSTGGSHLHLIVSRTAQVRDLCNYISYSILCAKADWITHTNLPSRFMENVNETLEEKGEGTLDQNLFHLAMTGNFTPTILEWLKDELAERGHKRWDHAMTTLHTELGKIFQTNLFPVLERCIVVTTNLRGLARYYEGSKKFDVSPEVFTSIIDALRMQQLLVHEAVQILGEESRQFRAFSRWLRHVIDIAAADPESVSAKDMAEREASNLDYPRILTYLEGALSNSRLEPIVRAQAGESISSDISQDELIRAIHQARTGDAARKDLLSLHTLSTHLKTVCKTAHHQILRWQNSATPSIEEVRLDVAAVSEVFDMRMALVKPSSSRTIVLTVPHDERNTMSIHAITTKTKASSESPSAAETTQTLTLPPNTTVHSIKFLDDTSIIVLISLSDDEENTKHQRRPQHHLMRLTYDATLDHPFSGIPNILTTSGADDNDNLEAGNDNNDLRRFIIHTFPTTEAFVPREMIVSGKAGAAVAVVVGDDYKAWKVFDLESASRSRGGVGGAAERFEGESSDEESCMVID